MVEIEPTERIGIWEMSYGPIVLGRLSQEGPERGLILPRRKRRTGTTTLTLTPE